MLHFFIFTVAIFLSFQDSEQLTVILFLPPPWALLCPYKVDDQVYSLKLCPLGRFFLVTIFQDQQLRWYIAVATDFDLHCHIKTNK